MSKHNTHRNEYNSDEKTRQTIEYPYINFSSKNSSLLKIGCKYSR